MLLRPCIKLYSSSITRTVSVSSISSSSVSNESVSYTAGLSGPGVSQSTNHLSTISTDSITSISVGCITPLASVISPTSVIYLEHSQPSHGNGNGGIGQTINSKSETNITQCNKMVGSLRNLIPIGTDSSCQTNPTSPILNNSSSFKNSSRSNAATYACGDASIDSHLTEPYQSNSYDSFDSDSEKLNADLIDADSMKLSNQIKPPYESIHEKSLLDELFSNSIEINSKSNHIIIKQPLPYVPNPTQKKLTGLKMVERISLIYASLESNKIDEAESLFFKALRINEAELKKNVNIKMISRIIQVLLENKAYSKPSYISRALEWYSSLPLYNLNPTSHTLALFIRYYLEKEDEVGAKWVLGEMDKSDIDIQQLIIDYQALRHTPSIHEFLISIDRPFIKISELLESVQPILPLTTPLSSTNTIGVSILRSSLPILPLDKYTAQLQLEGRSFKAAQTLDLESQRRMPKELRRGVRLDEGVVEEWRVEMEKVVQRICNGGEVEKNEETVVPFLRLVSPEVTARIVLATILKLPKDPESIDQTFAIEITTEIGVSLQREHNLDRMRDGGFTRRMWEMQRNGRIFDMDVRRTFRGLAVDECRREGWRPEWGVRVVTGVGALLLRLAVGVCVIPGGGGALEHFVVRVGDKMKGVVRFHPGLVEMVARSVHMVSPWALPMVIPPLPWLHANGGGYLQHRFPLVRTGKNGEHDEYIRAADGAGHLGGVMRGLDVLGATGWRVNREVYGVAAHFWNLNVPFLGMTSDVIPSEVVMPIGYDKGDGSESGKLYRAEVRRWKKKVMNAFSERCSVNYKLDIARAVLSGTNLVLGGDDLLSS